MTPEQAVLSLRAAMADLYHYEHRSEAYEAADEAVRVLANALAERHLYDCVCGGDLRIERERDAAVAERDKLREAIASAMISLSTGPARDGYAYSVLDAALGSASRSEPYGRPSDESVAPSVSEAEPAKERQG